MTRKEFIQRLKKEGSSIPTKEINNLVSYYEEILDDENISDYDEIPEKYNPKKIIEEFKKSNNFTDSSFEYDKINDRKIIKRIIIILLLLMLLPILIPIFITIFTVSIVSVIVVAVLFFTLFSLAYSMKTFLLGIVLFSIGIFILAFRLIVNLVKIFIHLFKVS